MLFNLPVFQLGWILHRSSEEDLEIVGVIMFLQARCHSGYPTSSVKALKEIEIA